MSTTQTATPSTIQTIRINREENDKRKIASLERKVKNLEEEIRKIKQKLYLIK